MKNVNVLLKHGGDKKTNVHFARGIDKTLKLKRLLIYSSGEMNICFCPTIICIFAPLNDVNLGEKKQAEN
jgi:hypothetical protein